MNRPAIVRSQHPARSAIVAVLVAACATVPADAAPSPRNYLTVQGRVTDPRGEPLPGTWVFCTGSRRSSAFVDSAGFYTLEIPGATLKELERAPLRIRIQARLKGWRFAMPKGAPELGLEMRVTKLESGLARLRVRSNDGDAVQAVAGSVVLEANPRALLEATFIGSEGAQYETPPVPLTTSDEITLAGDATSIPEVQVDSTATIAAVEREPPERLPEKPPIPAERPADTKPSPAPAIMTPAPAAAQASPPTSLSPPATTRPAAPNLERRSPPAADTTRQAAARPEVRESTPKSRAARDEKPGRPRVVRPALGDDGKDGREAKERKPVIVNPALPPRRTPPPPAPKTFTADPTGAAPAAVDSGAAAGGRPARKTPSADPTLKPVLIRTVTKNEVGQRPQSPPQPVTTAASDSLSPNRVGILRPSPLPPPRGQGPLPLCDCLIRGTVEVQSDRVLSSPTEVVISIEGTDVSTTVEMYMGSPRAFEIHPAPCGVHRIILHTRSKQRFVLVSAEPRLVCTEGGTQQVRLVLEPVARWGASR